MPDNGIQQNVPLAGYSTFRCGGPARFFAEPSDGYEVAWLFDWACDKNLKVLSLATAPTALSPMKDLTVL